jgi:hypothetical protein
MAEGALHLHLEILAERDPIEGTLTDDQGLTVEFTGWLALITALETARKTTPEPPKLNA